jgi:hypothetical protein
MIDFYTFTIIIRNSNKEVHILCIYLRELLNFLKMISSLLENKEEYLFNEETIGFQEQKINNINWEELYKNEITSLPRPKSVRRLEKGILINNRQLI